MIAHVRLTDFIEKSTMRICFDVQIESFELDQRMSGGELALGCEKDILVTKEFERVDRRNVS